MRIAAAVAKVMQMTITSPEAAADVAKVMEMTTTSPEVC